MSKFLSLEWFKSKIENAVEQVISKKINDLIEQENGEEDVCEKAYLNLKLVNDVLTVVMNDGSVLTKVNATEEDFNRVRKAKSRAEIANIIITPEIREEQRKHEAEVIRARAVKAGIERLKECGEFVIDGSTVYFKGISRSLPQLLVEEILEMAERNPQFTETDQFKAVKRFFMWCCLNPRAEVAHELYRFLRENSFRITKQGFFVALRNVVTLHGSNELVQFVSNTYNKVKAVWKKSPDDYLVYLHNGEYSLVHKDDEFTNDMSTCCECDGEGEIWDDYNQEYYDCSECNGEGEYEEPVKKHQGESLGTLTALYLDLPNRSENRFTDDWTKTFDIRIGRVVNMPLEKCNWSTQDCAAAGLHFTSDQIHYVGCGDTSVLVLINPMKVVGIGQHKGRCYEYLPIMTVPREEATSILHDLNFDTLQLDDAFAIHELENLEELAKQGFAVEARKYDFNIPAVNVADIRNIVNSLEEMKAELSNRVVNID